MNDDNWFREFDLDAVRGGLIGRLGLMIVYGNLWGSMFVYCNQLAKCGLICPLIRPRRAANCSIELSPLDLMVLVLAAAWLLLLPSPTDRLRLRPLKEQTKQNMVD